MISAKLLHVVANAKSCTRADLNTSSALACVHFAPHTHSRTLRETVSEEAKQIYIHARMRLAASHTITLHFEHGVVGSVLLGFMV